MSVSAIATIELQRRGKLDINGFPTFRNVTDPFEKVQPYEHVAYRWADGVDHSAEYFGDVVLQHYVEFRDRENKT